MPCPPPARARNRARRRPGLYALIAALFSSLALGLEASADFDYEVYDGSFDVLPDFSGPHTHRRRAPRSAISLSLSPPQTDTFALVFTIQIDVPTARGPTSSRRTVRRRLQALHRRQRSSWTTTACTAPVTVTSLHQPDRRAPRSPGRVLREGTGGQVLEVAYKSGIGRLPADPPRVASSSYTSSNESEVRQAGDR